MDDIIDLESEKIEAILNKVKADPEIKKSNGLSVRCGRIYVEKPSWAVVPELV